MKDEVELTHTKCQEFEFENFHLRHLDGKFEIQYENEDGDVLSEPVELPLTEPISIEVGGCSETIYPDTLNRIWEFIQEENKS